MKTANTFDRRPFRHLRYLARSIVAQCIAFVATVAVGNTPPLLTTTLSQPYLLPILHGVFAVAVARLLRLPFSWQLLNLLLPLALFLSLPFYLLVPLVVLFVLIYIPTFISGIPYYPTSRPTYDKILELLPPDRAFSFIDLGCGFGALLSFLAARRPSAHFEGIEIDVLPYLVTKLRSLFRRNLKAKFQSLWAADLSQFDVVYAFLAPGPMERLWAKVKEESKPGTIFISNSFQAPVEPGKVVRVEGRREFTLFIYYL